MSNTKLRPGQLSPEIITLPELQQALEDHNNDAVAHPLLLLASEAYNLPDKTGHALDVLMTNGIDDYWGTVATAHGIPNRTDASMTYDPVTRTLNLFQAGGFVYYYKGKKIIGPESISLQHGTGRNAYYFLFDTALGILKVQSTSWNLDNHITVCFVYWTGSYGKAWEERHGHLRNIPMHKYLHSTVGTRLVSGMIMSGYMLEEGDINSKVQWAVTAGSVADEDITVTTSALPAVGPYLLAYRDFFSPVSWNMVPDAVVPYKHGARIQYDNNGVLTDLVPGQYVNAWVYGISALSAPHVLVIIGQVVHETFDNALAETLAGLDFTNYPIKEAVPIYKVTYRCDDAYGTDGKAAIYYVEAIDISYRKAKQPTQYLDFIGTDEPAAPAVNHVSLYAQNRGGRLLPHWVENSGIESAVQPALFGNNVVMWLAGTGSIAAINFGASFTQRSGANHTHPALSGANAVTQMKRMSMSANNNNSAGLTTSAPVAWRGNAAKMGGFFFFTRFALEAYAATERLLIGLDDNNTALSEDPSTRLNTVCIGKDTADLTLQLICVDAVGGVTKINTGITPDPAQILDVVFFCRPNDDKIYARVVDPVNGIVYVNNIPLTEHLPSNSQFLYFQSQIQSVGGSVQKLLSLNRMYLETPT